MCRGDQKDFEAFVEAGVAPRLTPTELSTRGSSFYITPQCASSSHWEPAKSPARPWSKGMMEASHAFEPGSSPGGRNRVML